MLGCNLIQIYLILELLEPFPSLDTYPPQDILAHSNILYSGTLALAYRNFTIPFARTLDTTPSIAYAINHYHMADRFYYENFLTALLAIKKDHFTLAAKPIQSTAIYKLSISYFAIGDHTRFTTLTRSFLNPPVVSSSRGSRSVVIPQSHNFVAHPLGAAFVTGFYVQSINYFYLQATVSNTSASGFAVRVDTLSDCTIGRLDLSILFYYPSLIPHLYLIRIDSALCFHNLSAESASGVLSQADTSVYLMGMSGFGGNTYSSTISFGWSASSPDSISNSLLVTFNTANLLYLCYNVVQVWSLTPPPIVGSANSLPITLIIVLVCSGAGLFVLIFACRGCWGGKYYKRQRIQESRKQLSLANMNELPSLQF